MTKINEVELRTPKDNREMYIFGFVMEQLEAVNFGTVKFEATLKAGTVVNFKAISEKSIKPI